MRQTSESTVTLRECAQRLCQPTDNDPNEQGSSDLNHFYSTVIVAEHSLTA